MNDVNLLATNSVLTNFLVNDFIINNYPYTFVFIRMIREYQNSLSKNEHDARGLKDSRTTELQLETLALINRYKITLIAAFFMRA